MRANKSSTAGVVGVASVVAVTFCAADVTFRTSSAVIVVAGATFRAAGATVRVSSAVVVAVVATFRDASTTVRMETVSINVPSPLQSFSRISVRLAKFGMEYNASFPLLNSCFENE
mmetsp:Transcript_971/g.1072  ORF Transcript_971/g.1072 Transcript_971/m.1072 type:complete len:116 (-) Transcript_971:397-744(-)